MKEIIVINGSGGKGKDTFIEIFSEYFKTINFSSVDFVKEAATILGWRGGKTERDRKYLSDLKRLSIDYCGAPYNEARKAIKEFKKSSNEVMFLHIREPEEIQKIVNHCRAKTLLIKNDNIEEITSNSSDREVYNYKYDYVLNNSDGLDNLSKEVNKFITWLIS